MTLEVEQKFRVDDLSALLARLAKHAVALGDVVTQRDDYFNHPLKDFAETDEALRIRSCGEENRVTYKGPKRSLQTKTRCELELPIAPGSTGRAQFRELLLALGFRPVKMIEKRRRTGLLTWKQWEVEVAVDQVVGLGDFAELEIAAEESQFAAAEQALLSLAETLELVQVERRSYLEMTLATS